MSFDIQEYGSLFQEMTTKQLIATRTVLESALLSRLLAEMTLADDIPPKPQKNKAPKPKQRSSPLPKRKQDLRLRERLDRELDEIHEGIESFYTKQMQQ